jgi:hypothetical protein
MGGMLGRAARAADWLLWAGLGAGLGLYFGLARLHAAHTLTGDRWAGGARLGALALICACPGMLALGWAGRQLASARKTAAARREARRATLIKHADPLAGAVDEHGRQIEFLVNALAGVLRSCDVPAEDLEHTQPMLRLVRTDRDSA